MTLRRLSDTLHLAGFLLLLAGLTPAVPGQEFNASHIVIPQARGFALDRGDQIRIDGVRAEVLIVDRTARTTLDVTLSNPTNQRAEAVLLLPVPDGAVVSGFLFEGASSEPTAQVLRADEARRTYDQIVAQIRDPALLEFAGYNLIRSSVFPVEPNGTQRVLLTYESILDVDGERVDYILPRSESLEQRAPWTIDVDIRGSGPISMVYSPSHDLDSERIDARRLKISLGEHGEIEPGHFLLSCLAERGGLTASTFTYPDPKVGGGYFLMMAGLPTSLDDTAHTIKREVTLVLDRSGSMAGGKLEQVKLAAIQIIEGLADGEAFNIIDYSTTVSRFSDRPVLRNAETLEAAHGYLGRLRPSGGTNIHDALVESLRQPTLDGMLPLVLFLTDGLPTVGNTNEVAIRSAVEAGNPHDRRIFTFGVGADVNTPLLDRVADATRATSTYVLPDEDVELKVARVFRRLYGPVISDLELVTQTTDGTPSTRLVREIMPIRLPDLFDGDQLVLLGQYVSEEPFRVVLNGSYLGAPRGFTFEVDPSTATTANSFVPRLWASRRIAHLVDQIRQAGAMSAGQPAVIGATIFDDPRFAEISEEILRLSTEFGILTEYTAFLATEGTDLSDWNDLAVGCTFELDEKAVRTRSGYGAINQSLNWNAQKEQSVLNRGNGFVDMNLQTTQFNNVQQVCDRAFFNRAGRWIDSRLISAADAISDPPDEIIEFGSERHLEILHELVAEGRQATISMAGEIEMIHRGRRVLINN